MMRNCFFALLLLVSTFSFGQNSPEMLLNNLKIQIECTEAIDAMYNFDFETAEKQFTKLKHEYPQHPLPYFLMGLSNWWKIVPNDASITYDPLFFAYMDSTIEKSEVLYKNNKDNYEAAFFLAGANAMKGRRLAEHGSYTKAAWAGKAALNYLNENMDKSDHLGPEFLFGSGLYNYFREWIPEHKKFFKPLLVLFKKGDKELGLQQLEKVSNEAFYTKIESRFYLLDIYAQYESGVENREKGLKVAENLRSSYPNNPYFQRYYTKLLYDLGHWNRAEAEARDILNRIDAAYIGYEAESGRYACYYLAMINKYRLDRLKNAEIGDATILLFEKYLVFAKEADAMEKGFTRQSYLHLARLYAAKEEKNTAVNHYEAYLNLDPSKKQDAYKEAKQYIKDHKEKTGWF